jgi:nucleoside-diphosphate kinase
MERTLVLLKPDAVQQQLIGEIIGRFEKGGLKVVATKMVWPSRELADKHYPTSRKPFIEGMGGKTLEGYKEQNMDPVADFGSDDPHEIGLQLQKWLVDFLSSSPVIAIVFEGHNAIKKGREIAGHTIPAKADKGSVRGDLSDDDAIKANTEKRPVRNLVHASGEPDEAEFEIGLWFDAEELHDY